MRDQYYGYFTLIDATIMNTNLKQHIGMRVKIARRAQQLSQEQLAEHIERTTETVSNIERAVTVPSIETLERLGVEMEIGQFLTRLSFSQLEIASIQIKALIKMDQT